MTKLQAWTMTGLGTLALMVGALLATGAISSGQSPTPTPSATEDTTDGDPDTDKSDGSSGGHWCGGGANPLVFDNAGEILGMTQEELREARASGQTLAEIAQAHGMTVEDFTAALVAAVTADLQAQLDAGEITQERFDEATANLSDKITAIINSEGGLRFHGLGRHLTIVLSAAEEVLGVDEIALDDGQTLAEFAEAQGMSVEDFKAALMANITADLQARLDAGEITQEQFDEKIANLSDKLDDIINAEGGLRFHGPGPGFDDGTRFRFVPQPDNTDASTDA